MALYKHHDELAPKYISKPLKRGKWFHSLMEAYYSGEDWKAVHKSYCAQFAQLFDEEKDKLGNLPVEMSRLMRSYLWHYHNDADWKVHEVEVKLEATLPSGLPYMGKLDLLVENKVHGGLWLVDHKSHAQMPSFNHRLIDQQSVLYIWAARKNKIPVEGFIWNYVRTNPPKQIRLTKATGRIVKNQGATDYPTAYMSLKAQGEDPADHKDFLRPLAAHRYQTDEVQTSPFFQRVIMEKNPAMIKRALMEADHTAVRFQNYDFENRDAVERAIDRSCDWCGYQSLCTTELIGGNADLVIKQQYQKQDPHSYYEEDIYGNPASR